MGNKRSFVVIFLVVCFLASLVLADEPDSSLENKADTTEKTYFKPTGYWYGALVGASYGYPNYLSIDFLKLAFIHHPSRLGLGIAFFTGYGVGSKPGRAGTILYFPPTLYWLIKPWDKTSNGIYAYLSIWGGGALLSGRQANVFDIGIKWTPGFLFGLRAGYISIFGESEEESKSSFYASVNVFLGAWFAWRKKVKHGY